MARIHGRTFQNGLHDLDDLDGVVTHQELDILECEVKWTLGSITTKKASGGDGIPVELLKILKDDAVKASAALSMPANLENSAVATELEKPVLNVIRKAMPKNAQTTAQLHSSLTLVK